MLAIFQFSHGTGRLISMLNLCTRNVLTAAREAAFNPRPTKKLKKDLKGKTHFKTFSLNGKTFQCYAKLESLPCLDVPTPSVFYQKGTNKERV